jgi:cysteinyl-tRNA synthetase
MEHSLFLYNTLTRYKELFKPIHEGHVGMYVCGPTVYGDAHLGHARPAITFDLLFRYLQKLGYKVRYVRNITDVGHLEHDADEGEDKIAKKARLEQLEPMEVAQYYTNRFHEAMAALNCLPPSIEPHATGHIIEQQQLVKEILDNGFAYESNGSIYFDVEGYNEKHKYGILSGRSLENIKDASRELAGVGEKKNQADFALWKKAQPEHIMRWPSPWGMGFPGWHCECTAMGRKYLGDHFDIHGGGMDLIFPHHECEIAQAVASQGDQMVHYWVHNNMITINGQKMGKSYNNFITLPQFFSGQHEKLTQAYSPMTIRFFILQAHYRSPLDFSDQALQAAERGLKTLMEMIQETNEKIVLEQPDSVMDKITTVNEDCMSFLYDDMATPQVLSSLFSLREIITGPLNKREKIELQSLFSTIVGDLLGLSQETSVETKPFEEAVNYIIGLRKEARDNKDWKTSDKIRDFLENSGFEIKDTNSSTKWKLK